MKNFILVFCLALTSFSCSKSDDDSQSVDIKTGTWKKSYSESNGERNNCPELNCLNLTFFGENEVRVVENGYQSTMNYVKDISTITISFSNGGVFIPYEIVYIKQSEMKLFDKKNEEYDVFVR